MILLTIRNTNNISTLLGLVREMKDMRNINIISTRRLGLLQTFQVRHVAYYHHGAGVAGVLITTFVIRTV